jgi:hypothetical protein
LGDAHKSHDDVAVSEEIEVPDPRHPLYGQLSLDLDRKEIDNTRSVQGVLRVYITDSVSRFFCRSG